MESDEIINLRRQVRLLRAEAERREAIWLSRLQEADKRAEHILRRTVSRFMEPPVIIIDKGALNLDEVKLAMKAGSVITAGEWPKTERTVIEVSEVVYFRDFLRSLWRRLQKRSPLMTWLERNRIVVAVILIGLAGGLLVVALGM